MDPKSKFIEGMRTTLYRRLPEKQPSDVDERAVKVFSKQIAEHDAKKGNPMDPYILQHIEGPNKEGVHQYAKTYKKYIEKMGGRRKHRRGGRKTRRVKKLNGRK